VDELEEELGGVEAPPDEVEVLLILRIKVAPTSQAPTIVAMRRIEMITVDMDFSNQRSLRH
jgi:hypothetical protein